MLNSKSDITQTCLLTTIKHRRQMIFSYLSTSWLFGQKQVYYSHWQFTDVQIKVFVFTCMGELRIKFGRWLNNWLYQKKLSFIKVLPDPCDLVAPIQWATDQKKDVDVFIIVTDANRSTSSRNLGEAIAQYRKDRNLPNTK